MTTITRIQLENFGGVKTLDVRPGLLTVLKGENGAGKTTVLEAVRAALANHKERVVIVNDEASMGRLLFELSNGMSGTRTVTNDGRSAGALKLRQNDRTIRKPEGVLAAMVGGGFGLNPVAFLGLSDARQREEILKVTKIDLPYDEAIRLSAGRPAVGVNYDAHPLEVLKAIEADLYDYRRDVNRDATHRRNAAEKLRESADSEVDTELLRNFDLDAAIAKMTRAQDSEAAIGKYERRIGELNALMATTTKELERTGYDLDDAKSQRVDIAPVRADIELFKNQQNDWRKLQQANDEDQLAETAEEQAAGLTALIEETRGKPAELLRDAHLPVRGLAIAADGSITVNGLPITDLSAGEKLAQVAVPVALATLPQGDDGMQVVLVDGLETLDPANRRRMLTQLADAGVQVLAAEVGEGELTIITDYGDDDDGDEYTSMF